MRYLSLGEVLVLHAQLIARSGGPSGLVRLPGLEAAIALPRQTFGGADLYPTVAEKATVLGFALIQNHPFADGNKRVGHAALETFLMLNGYELLAPVEEAEGAILNVAAGRWAQADLLAWVERRIARRTPPPPAR
jgi:death-on-curing protein